VPHRVVTVAQDDCLLLDIAIPVHVFGHHGGDRYVHKVAGPRRGSVRSSTGLQIVADGGPRLLTEADTVVVGGYSNVTRRPPPGLLDELRAAAARGSRMISISTGAFTLAWAGLLDGHRATTHWLACPMLAEMFPAVTVERDVLYIDEHDVLTSAGVAAGLDLCMHVVRSDHGAALAADIARHTDVAPHRDGAQAQFVPRPRPVEEADTPLGPTLVWALEHLDQPLDVKGLARRAGMSVRTLARHFRAETGTTPLRWLVTRRVIQARRLLETTDLPIETVAHRCGFSSSAHLRRNFDRMTGTSPQAYRATFAFDQTKTSGRMRDGMAASARHGHGRL
jgi:AraC family transcriptional regulator, transcriptional activator FtrA